MIRYALACEAGHEFESWFPSASSYDEQAARGFVSCPACGSASVTKRIMAPALGRGSRKGAAGPEGAQPVAASPIAPTAPAGEGVQAPVALLSEREQALRAMVRAVREHVTKSADYVGPSFAAEARKMHYGEIEHRSIYGEANALDAKALAEEGIAFQPLPILPDDRN